LPQFLPSAAETAIVALGEHFNNELMEILYTEIQRKDVSILFVSILLENSPNLRD
jgi:hypothetical protein